MIFKKYNPNPKGKRTGDCVVRAVATALNKTWEETYKELCAEGLLISEMPNSKKTYENVLEKNGFKKHKMPKHENGTRFTVRRFAQDNKGIAVVSVANHLTVLEDNAVIDTWDCSFKCVGNYYKK